MKELAINKNHELQLPNSYVDVERKEMEFVDGGWTIIRTAETIKLRLTGAETNTLINSTSTGIHLMNEISVGIGSKINIFNSDIVKAYRNLMIKYNANNSGVSFIWTLSKPFPSLPAMLDNY